jgi:hypothetical protein
VIAAVDWGTFGEVLGGFGTAMAVLVVPAAVLFHRRVIRPLRWVLGVSAAASPTGEEVKPVPIQLAELRQTATVLLARTEELQNNGGGSMKDLARKTHRLAVSTNRELKEHLTKSAESEAAMWRALAEFGTQAKANNDAAVAFREGEDAAGTKGG